MERDAWGGITAAALSIPLALSTGEAFPHRNEILFISFIVILSTLVLQGLSLPLLIRKLDIHVKNNEREHELEIQTNLVSAVLLYINTKYAHEAETNDAFRMLKERYEYMLEVQQKQLLKKENAPSHVPVYRKALLELIDVRRKALEAMRVEGKYPDELIRNIERELDHEEARLRAQLR